MEYKVAILDDEVLMREGLVLKYPFHKNGFEIIFSDDDGHLLLEKMEKNEIQPDLIFADIVMPKMNGLHFIKEVLNINKNIDVVVVSGFDDFDFAQQAIRLGVKEYLLKPINPIELENVMQRITVSLNKKKAEEISRHQAELNNWIVHKNIADIKQSSLTFLKEILEQFPNFYVVLLGNFKSEPQPLSDTFINHSFPINYLGFNNLFIYFEKENNDPEFLKQSATKTSTVIHFTHLKSAEDFPHCIMYAINLIRLHLTLGKRTLHSIKWSKDLMEHRGIEFNEQHQSILEAFYKEKDKEKGFLILKKLLNKQMPQKLKEEAVRHFAREHFQLEISNEWLQGYNNPDEFNHDCVNFLKDLGNFPQPTSGKEILYSVLNDLKKEFPLRISLKDYAERYHIHQNHLIRLFKKEMNTSFNDSVTKIRIEKAKEELLNSQKKIQDIAIDIGYDDARYFSQVFKKHLNMTPNEFRKRFQIG